MKHLLISRGLLLLLPLVMIACGGPGFADTQNVVHLNDTSFDPSSISIKKGETITLIDDTTTVHMIANGTWDANGTERPGRELGAPHIDVQLASKGSTTIGPFITAGTFLLYCAVHPGMDLKVIVS